MFRRRRGLTLGKILGLALVVIGFMIQVYIIPVQLWIFILGCGCIIVGILIYKW